MTQSSDPKGGEELRENTVSEEEIDETLKESFPASDPSQWTLGMEPHDHQKDEAEVDEKDEASE